MKPPPLRERLREATSVAILEAAERLAADQGIAAVSIQAIAEGAGTGVGTIYNYFRDREGLFEALFSRRRVELYAAIDEAQKLHAREPFAGQLEALVRAVLGFFDQRQAFLRLAFEVERAPIVKGQDGARRPAVQQLQERFERVVRVGLRESRLRDESPELLATVLVSLVRGVLLSRALGHKPSAPETERILALFLRGAGR